MGQIKFGRNYTLSIELQDTTVLTVKLPFTVEFDVTRNTLTSANVCQIRILNLSAKNRNLIRFDFSNYGSNRRVSLMAGYGTNLPLIFTGYITQAWSVREGVDFITTIQCFDGGDAFVNGIIPSTTTFPAGTPMQSVYKTLMGYLPNVAFGAIGDSFIKDASGNLIITSRSSSYTGNIADVLNELSGRAFFIDNGKSYILKDNEYIQGQVSVIDANSGLLNTPLREQNTIIVDMIFEPGIIMAQLIQLNSLTNSIFSSSNNTSSDNVNGYYKVSSIKHKATISDSVCGNAITNLQLILNSTNLLTVT